MPRRKKNIEEEPKRQQKPALTPESRENQLIAAAINLAEKQLLDGTASAQVITHYLKLGSTKDRLEREILEKQKELISAKTQTLQSAQRIEDLYESAIKAMRSYGGGEDAEDSDVF